MAGPWSILASLLPLALCVYCATPTGSVVIPSACCISFISKKIPESRVVSYQVSNRSSCLKAAVIFTTKQGLKICSDPKQLWVQKYMRILDAKQKQQQPPTEARARVGKAPGQRCCGNRTTS